MKEFAENSYAGPPASMSGATPQEAGTLSVNALAPAVASWVDRVS